MRSCRYGKRAGLPGYRVDEKSHINHKKAKKQQKIQMKVKHTTTLLNTRTGCTALSKGTE